jgi:hypothetical protein
LRTVVTRPGGFLAAAVFEHAGGMEDQPRPPVVDGIWTAADAIHWSPISGTPLGTGELIPVPGGFMAAGSASAAGGVTIPEVWESADGQGWIRVALPRQPDIPEAVSISVGQIVAGPAGLLAFGERDDNFSTVGWSSADGTTWTPLELTPALQAAQIEQAVLVNGSILLLGQLATGGVYTPADWLLTP